MLTKPFLIRYLDELGQLLLVRQQPIEAVAIGGGAMLLTGLIERPTEDLDLAAIVKNDELVFAEPLPKEFAKAIGDIARLNGLPSDWLNGRPTDIIRLGLPSGFMTRASSQTFGALTIHLASRIDQIALKLHATADHDSESKHFADLRRLTPSRSELLDAARWTRTHDPSPEFRSILVQVLEQFDVADDGSF